LKSENEHGFHNYKLTWSTDQGNWGFFRAIYAVNVLLSGNWTRSNGWRIGSVSGVETPQRDCSWQDLVSVWKESTVKRRASDPYIEKAGITAWVLFRPS
jgi:hypothetical protein